MLGDFTQPVSGGFSLLLFLHVHVHTNTIFPVSGIAIRDSGKETSKPGFYRKIRYTWQVCHWHIHMYDMVGHGDFAGQADVLPVLVYLSFDEPFVWRRML